MKTVKQTINKALCLMISALLLTTSLPMQVFADGGGVFGGRKPRWQRQLTRELRRLPEEERAALAEEARNATFRYAGPVNPTLGRYYTIEYNVFGGEVQGIFKQTELSALFSDRTLFSEVDTYIKEPIKIEVIQKEQGFAYITNLEGKWESIGLEELETDYVKASQLGPKWRQSAGQYNLRRFKYNMNIEEKGIVRHIPAGSYVDVDKLAIYFPANAKQFKSVRALYMDSLNFIQKIGARMELTISKHFPQFEGLLFKPLVTNSSSAMEKHVINKEFTQQAVKKGAKKALFRRLFLAALGLTALTTLSYAPKAEAAEIEHTTIGDILNQQEGTEAEGINYEGVTEEDFFKMSPLEQVNFYTSEHVYRNPEKYPNVVVYMKYAVIPEVEKELNGREAKDEINAKAAQKANSVTLNGTVNKPYSVPPLDNLDF